MNNTVQGVSNFFIVRNPKGLNHLWGEAGASTRLFGLPISNYKGVGTKDQSTPIAELLARVCTTQQHTLGVKQQNK